MTEKKDRYRVIAENRRARFDYELTEILEVGIVLLGSEVKSLRNKNASINESFAGPMEGEIYLFNTTIPEYGQANRFNHEPKRPRKLLMRKRQRDKFMGAIQRKGMTVVPLKLYFNSQGLVKLEIALGKGKKVHDKRESIKERDWNRDKARVLREK